MPNTLPEFDRPPLDEVAIGLQFEPLGGFHVAHLGLYWSQIRDRYPITEDQGPLAPQIEQEQPAHVLNVSIAGVSFVPPRAWFVNAGKNELIQLQHDRFVRNWRRLSDIDEYPRYANLARDFRREWEGFLAFLQQEKIGQPTVNQCELSYINNLETWGAWQDLFDVEKVCTLVCRSGRPAFLPAPEVLALNARYKLPQGRGRLHFSLQPGFRGRDMKLVQALNLVARGAPEGSDLDKIFAWFDMAHEWVVRAFDELTVPELHTAWGKKS
jgi:hypothetical protein